MLGILLVVSWDFNFLVFYMNYSKEAKSLTFRRGSKASQDCGTYITHPLRAGSVGFIRSAAAAAAAVGARRLLGF